jgi:hypothetical protein
MWITTARTLALLSLTALGWFLAAPRAIAAPRLSPEAAQRTAWLYNKGAFRKVGTTWVEQNATRRANFRETQRTAHFVTLYDASRKMHVRLYDTTVYYWTPERGKWTFLYHGRWQGPSKKPLDEDRFPDERGKLTNPTERKEFPHLGNQFQVLGPATPRYNCIAWSIGITTQWVWPAKPNKAATVADFDELYGKHGYRRVRGLNYERQANYDKIVLYAKRTGNTWEPTHGARQLSDGSWSSKLGKLPLIRHLEPEDIDGGSYGVPIAVYVRARNVAKR